MMQSPHISIRSLQDLHMQRRGGFPIAKKKENEPKDWKIIISFVVVYTMIFFNGCCFTAVVPSVPFFLQFLQAPPEFLGWVVSFYSLGQIFGSPTAGWLVGSDDGKTGWSSKSLLTFSSTMGLLSSAMYAMAPSYSFILISRLLTGFSAGLEFTTELTFIANNTTPQQRTAFLASVTAVNVVGFIMGPAVSMVLSNAINIELLGGLITVNNYTSPGWLLTGMFCVDLIMVRYLFNDQGSQDDKKPTIAIKAGDDESDDDEHDSLLGEELDVPSYGGVKKPDDKESGAAKTPEPEAPAAPPSILLVISLIFVQFSLMCGFSLLETITSPLVQDEFEWDVRDCNFLFTCGGFVSLCAYVAFVLMSRCIQDRKLVVISLGLSFMGFLLGVDWQKLDWVPDHVASLMPSYLVRFLAGFAFMNAGFMTGRPVVFALYSKLIAREYQGRYLGWMVAGGSAARTLGPFAAVFLYYNVEGAGENLFALFGSFVLFHSACIALVIWQWPELLPKDLEESPGIEATEVKEKKVIVPRYQKNKPPSRKTKQNMFQTKSGSSILTI